MKKLTLSELSLIMKETISEYAKRKLVTMKPIANKDDKRIPDVEFEFCYTTTIGYILETIGGKIQQKGEQEKKGKKNNEKAK